MAQIRTITFTNGLANAEEQRILAGVAGVTYKICGLIITGVASGEVLLKDGAGTGVMRFGLLANTPMVLPVVDPLGRANYGRTASGTGLRIRRITGGATLTTATVFYVEEGTAGVPAA